MTKFKFLIMIIMLLIANSYSNPMCVDRANSIPFEDNNNYFIVKIDQNSKQNVDANDGLKSIADLVVDIFKLLAIISIPFSILFLINRSIIVNAVKTRSDMEQRINDELTLEISKSLLMIRTLQEKNSFFSIEQLSRISRIIGAIRKYSFQVRSDIASGIVFIDEFYKGLVIEYKASERQLLTYQIADFAFDYLGYISYQAKNEVSISTITFKNILLYCGVLPRKASIKHPIVFGPFANYLTESNLWIFSRVALLRDDFLAIEVLDYIKKQFHVLNALKYHQIYIPLQLNTLYKSFGENESLKFMLFRFDIEMDVSANVKRVKGYYTLENKHCIISEIEIDKIDTKKDCLFEKITMPMHISKWKKIVHASHYNDRNINLRPKTPIINFEYEYNDCIKSYETNRKIINKKLEEINVG